MGKTDHPARSPGGLPSSRGLAVARHPAFARLVLLTVLAVLVGLVSVPFDPSADQAAASEPLTSVKAAVTPRAASEAPPPPQQTREEAQKAARRSGQRVKVLDLTTETEQTWANPDGSWTTETATGPERVKGSDGAWHPIDTRLVERDGVLAPAYAATDLTLSDGGNSTFASLSRDGMKLAWRWPGKLPKPTVQGDTATYPDVVPGGDLVVTALDTGFTHSIVLRRRPSDRMRITIPMTMRGAALVKTPQGGLSIQDQNGHDVLGAPRPLMWDSTENEAGDPKHLSPVDVSVGQDGAGGPGFMLSPSSSFLDDPATDYPVTIDPSFTKWTNGDAWLENPNYTSGQTSSPELRVGTYDSGGHKARSFLHFDTTTWNGTVLSSASLVLRNFYSGSCTGATILARRISESWSGSTMTWSNQPAATTTHQASYSPAHGYNSNCGAANATWDVKSIVQDWANGPANGGATNNGILLRASDETSIYTWRKYRSANYSTSSVRPRIVATYNSYPTKPSGLTTSPSVSCVTGSSRPDMTSSAPTLKATVADPDQGTVYGKFEIYEVGGTTAVATGTSAGVGSGSVASWKVPTGKLQPGHSYSWKVRSYDTALYSSYSASCEFKVALPTPSLDPPTTLHATGADLSWSPYSNPNDTITEYQIHRSTSASFTPTDATRLVSLPVGTTSWTDGTAPSTSTGATYYYRVAVKTAGGALVYSPAQVAALPQTGATTRIFGTTSPSTDTTLASSQPATNLDSLGGQPALEVGNNSTTYGAERAVLDFGDLTGIASGSRVLSAALGLWSTANSGSGASFEAHALSRGFDEAAATWNNADATTAWTKPGGDFDTASLGTPVSISGTAAWQNLDVSSAVKDWLTNPGSNHGLLVKAADESTQNQRVTFASNESSTATQRPRLVVTYLTKTTENTYYAPYTPQLMSPNDDEKVKVTVTNTTSTKWLKADWVLSYHWQLPDGTTPGGNDYSPNDTAAATENRELPTDLASGESADVTATVHPPVNAQTALRSDWLLAWDLHNRTTGQWLSQVEPDLHPLAQTVTIDKPPAKKLGLEDYFQYVGQQTGAGSTLLVNQYYGNAVWSYDAFSNPSRGVNTFARMTYNSNDKSDTPLGWGWSLSTSTLDQVGTPLDFEPAGQNIPDSVGLVDGDGTTHVFRYNQTTKEYDHPDGVHLFLQQTGLSDPTQTWVMTRPDGTKFYFDDAGYHTSTVDRNGNTLTFTYNPVDNNSANAPKQLTSITDDDDRTTLTFDYYEKGQDYSYIDTNGAKQPGASKLTDPDIIGQVESLTDVSDRKISFTYTDTGLLGEMVDGDGATGAKRFRFGYDPTQTNTNTSLISVEDPRGNTTRVTYAAPPDAAAEVHWRVETLKDRSGHTTRFTYTDPDANTGADMHSTVTDGNGHDTDYVMDPFGRPTKVTNAQSKATILNWDNDNNVILLEKPPASAGKAAPITTWTYDKVTGYPLTITDPVANDGTANPAAARTELTYQTTLNGHVANLATKTSALGTKTTSVTNDFQWAFGYDGNGNLTAVTDPEGVATATAGDYQTTYTYDPDTGDLATVTDADGNTTTYADYDATGNPKTITDAKLHDTTAVYDDRGNLTSLTDANNSTSTYNYDVFGRLLETREPKSGTDTVVTPAPKYDPNDNVLEAYAPYINTAPATLTTWSNTYDPMDQLESSSAPKDSADGPDRTTSYTYDAVGNLLTVTEPKGNNTPNVADDFVTANHYDTLDQLDSVTNADNDKITYAYDDTGNLSTVTDPKKVASTDPSDFTTKYTYDLDGRVLTVTDGGGKQVRYGYDDDGRKISTIDQATQETTTKYDMRGLVTEVRVPHDPGGPDAAYRITQYGYDQVGNRTTAVSPRGVDTSDPNDFTTQWTYDALNKVSQETLPQGTGDTSAPDYLTYDYDAVGNLSHVTSPPSNGSADRAETSYDYYDNGSIKKSTDPWEITTSYDYNAMGEQTQRTVAADDASGRTQSWTYYPDGKLASHSDTGLPVGAQVVVVDNTDVQNVKASAAWDSVQDTDHATYRGPDYQVHAAGTGTDPFKWNLVFPTAGDYQVFARWGDQATATNATYTVNHASGSATSSQDQTATANVGKWVSLGTFHFDQGTGKSITLSDQANGTVAADAVRLVRVRTQTEQDTKQDKDFSYAYDANANLKKITDSTALPDAATPKVGEYDVDYTNLDQVSSVAQLPTAGANPDKTTSYTYDPNGNIDSLTHDIAGSTNTDQYSKYTYGDPRDLLTKVSVGTSPTDTKDTTFTYDDRGLRDTETKGNGNKVTYQYFADQLLKNESETKADGSTVVSQHDLTYTLNGDRKTDKTRLMNADNNNAYLDFIRNYTYDGRDRVTKVEKKDLSGTVLATESYTYDGANNITDQTVNGVTTSSTYDRNRLLKASMTDVATGTSTTADYNYDPTGRLDTVIAEDTRKVLEAYQYDGFDHVAKYSKFDGTTTNTTTYAYDPLDRKTSRTRGTKTTDFAYLGLTDTLLSETDDTTGDLSKTYTYTPWGERLSQIKHNTDGTTEASYYGYNPHTDVETLTTASGNTRATYGYTAYGQDDKKADTGVDKPDPNDPTKEPYNPYRYTAKRFEPVNGNVDMGFRDYSPGLNQFLTRDSYNGALDDLQLATSPWSSNRYGLAGGNPISGVELDGHMFVADPTGGMAAPTRSSDGGGGGSSSSPSPFRDLYSGAMRSPRSDPMDCRCTTPRSLPAANPVRDDDTLATLLQAGGQVAAGVGMGAETARVRFAELLSPGRHAGIPRQRYVIGLRAMQEENWHALSGGAHAGPGRAAAFSRWSRAGKVANVGGSVLTGGIAGIEQWNADADAGLTVEARAARAGTKGALTAAGAYAGAWAGAEAGVGVGAMIGSFVPVPGVGTAAGAAVGGVVGGLVGGAVGSGAGGWLGDKALGLIDW